jgi:hypothetical protein
MFHYIENKNYNLKNNEYEKFKNISNQNSLKPIQQPVQNFNIYNNFENFDNFNQKQEQSFQKSESQNRDPTDVSFDKLKYYRNNDLEKFKEIQGGYLIN